MVANGTKGISTRDGRKQLDGQAGIDRPDRFEIEQGCLLYVDEKTLDSGIHIEEDRTFWSRIVVLHASHIVSGIDDKLLTDFRNNFSSIVVLCYEGTDRLPLNKNTVVCIDMHLNWLSKQIVKNDIPKASLLTGFLNGHEVTYIDKQIAVSQEAVFDLVNHVKNNDDAAKHFLLKHYFYKLLVQCINRMLVDRSRLSNNDDLDFLTKEKKISKAVAAMNHSLQRKFPGVGELAFISGMSVSSFLEKFHAVYEETPFEYFKKNKWIWQ